MNLLTSRDGYVYLLTVLFIGIIAFSVVGTYLVLSISSLQNGITVEYAAQALLNASTCAERGLLSLQNDANYGGEESFTLSDGTCEILEPVGSGNNNRSLCTEGISGNSTRRIEIVISQLLPSMKVFSWREVADFSACSY
jgi:hypothetical protein